MAGTNEVIEFNAAGNDSETIWWTASIVVEPEHGSAFVDWSSGSMEVPPRILYAPDEGFVGIDNFKYGFSSPLGKYRTAYVYVAVGLYPWTVEGVIPWEEQGIELTEIVTVTGLEDMETSSFPIQPIPNPSNTQVTFDLAQNFDPTANYDLRVYNLLGQTVKHQIVENANPQIVVEVNTWQQGVYVYQLRKNGTQVASGKMVVD